MLRRLLKTGVAVALHATNTDRLLAKVGGSGGVPVVVGYHRTVEEFPSDSLSTIPSSCITTRMLEQQLDWIGRRFRFVSLDELGEHIQFGSRPPRPIAAVTFDDGYHDVYELAFPLLKKKGIPAGVFVVTDLIGTSQVQIHDLLYLLLSRANWKWDSTSQTLSRFLVDLDISASPPVDLAAIPYEPHAALEFLLGALTQSEILRVIEALQGEVEIPQQILKEHRSMSWQQVIEMQTAGITIGSHSRTHAILPNDDPEKLASETAGSRVILEKHLRSEVGHFAYPCGLYNTATVKAVAQAGYRFGYTICNHRDSSFPLLTIPRKMLWEKSCLNAMGSFSPSVLSCQVHGALDFFSRCKMDHTRQAQHQSIGRSSGNSRELVLR